MTGHGIAREMASYSKSYRRIFARPGGLIENVAMILTGIGDVTTSKRTGELADPWYLETADAEDPDALRLAVGNIGGVWIARDGQAEPHSGKVDQVNKHWLGAQHDDFRRCSLSGGESGRPGVVVLAVEPEKGAIVLEARRSLARHDGAAQEELTAPDSPGLPPLQRSGEAGGPRRALPAQGLGRLHVIRRLGEEQLRVICAGQVRTEARDWQQRCVSRRWPAAVAWRGQHL